MDAIIIRYINTETTIKGFTVLDENGDYNIYLNANLTAEGQINAFRHEVKHILNKDFSSEESVYSIEKRLSNF